MRQYIEKQRRELVKALPKNLTVDRFIRSVMTLSRSLPALAKCNMESILGGIFTAAQLGLEFTGGQAFLVPFRQSGQLIATFIVGYKGYVQLFYRHAKGCSLSMDTAKEGDSFEYQLGTDPYIRHIKKKGRGDSEYHWASAKLGNGEKVIDVWTHEDCISHGKKFSKTFSKNNGEFSSYSPWLLHQDAMCQKTVLRSLVKTLPMASEFETAARADESARYWSPGDSPVLLPPEREVNSQDSEFPAPPPLSDDDLIEGIENLKKGAEKMSPEKVTAIIKKATKDEIENWDQITNANLFDQVRAAIFNEWAAS